MSTHIPDVLMLLGTQCPYCAPVLDTLSQLVKKGKIGKLEVVNLEQHPEIARELGVRGVPWVRIGPFELTGLLSPAKLESWVSRVGSDEGMQDYFSELLDFGDLDKVEAIIRKQPDDFKHLLAIFPNPDATLNMRLGVGAIMETFADSEIMHRHVDGLAALTRHDSSQVRIDACHYLSLTGLESVRQHIEPLLDDPDDTVKESAKECLDELLNPA
jgi:glutaredoxin